MNRVILAAAAALVLTVPTLAHAQELSGPARVIDGDTIVVNGTHIRLHGIDAPESAQSCTNASGQAYACGTVATQALTNLLAGQNVTCQGTGFDRYGRTLAGCHLANGLDIEKWMTRNGYAIAYSHFSHDYDADQAEAKAAHLGIWSGSFQEPYLWRQEHRYDYVWHTPHYHYYYAPSYGYGHWR